MKKKNNTKVKGNSTGVQGVSLAYSLSMRIIVLVVAAVFILGGVENTITGKISSERINDLATQAAQDNANLVESRLETLKDNVYSMAYYPTLSASDSIEELDSIRDAFISQYGLKDVFFVNANGQIFDKPEYQVGAKSYVVDALANGFYVSSPMTYDGGSHVIYISAPIMNGNYDGGVVVAVLDTAVFDELVTLMNVGGYGEGFIFNNEGTYVASVDIENVEAETNYITLAETDSSYADRAEAYQQVLDNESGTYSYGKITGAYATIEGTDGWKIGVEVNKSDLNGLYTVAGISSAIIMIIAIAAAIINTRNVVKSVTNPTNVVINRLDGLKDGDLSKHEVPNLHFKELNRLGGSLTDTITNLRNYVSEIRDTLSMISEKNLNVEITQDYVGDFAEIKESLIGISDSLNATINRIDSVSRDVLAASEQVSSSSQLLAQGATEQAGTLEELVTEIDGVSKKIAKTAEVAVDANSKTEDVKNDVVKSNEKMQELSEAMAAIDDTSRQVAKVVKMIEDIAFQTNILALNAAVEAARAGQSGKGFAVVANEVKNLANKSAEAAGDTTKLITNTIDAVKKGMDISGETAEILASVVSSVDDVAKIVSDISVASNEESGAIGRVVEGLDQVSVVVQSNSATAEESSALSAELETNAKKLQELVAEFQLKDE